MLMQIGVFLELSLATFLVPSPLLVCKVIFQAQLFPVFSCNLNTKGRTGSNSLSPRPLPDSRTKPGLWKVCFQVPDGTGRRNGKREQEEGAVHRNICLLWSGKPWESPEKLCSWLVSQSSSDKHQHFWLLIYTANPNSELSTSKWE